MRDRKKAPKTIWNTYSSVRALFRDACVTETPAERAFWDPMTPEKSRAHLNTREFIISLQVMLARLGDFKRPFDGEIDEPLVAGIDAYRKDRDFPAGRSVFDQAIAERVVYDTTALDLTTSIDLQWKMVTRSRSTTGADGCGEVEGMSFVYNLVDGSKASAGLMMKRVIERNRVLGLTGGP